MLSTIVITVHVIVALALIGIVLVQKGKGATMGAAFGGSSQTLFGPRGPAAPLAKFTTGAAIVFMLTSISLTIISNDSKGSSVISDIGIPEALPTTLPDEEPPAPIGSTPTDLPGPGPVETPADQSSGDEGPVGPTGG